MEIRGKVVEINLDAEITKNGGGTYQGATISYRDKDNKLQEKAFHSNALKFNAALKNGLENLQASDNFVATAEKNDKGFWEWKSIAKGSASAPAAQAAPASKPATTTQSGNWATAEERANTQVFIVRQSSIANALKLFEIQGNKKVGTLDVLNMAAEFEAWVFGKQVASSQKKLAVVNGNEGSFDDLEDDIPL